MERIPTSLPEVFIIKPQVFKDDRGFFFESYSQNKMASLGYNDVFVQDNHSKSIRNTIRGLHFQAPPEPQIKLIRCTRGTIWDVVVDIRPSSPLFKKWIGTELTDENKLQVLVPVGFAHGFSVISDWAEIEYKVTAHYNADLDRTIAWNDPTIDVDWKVTNPILSNRDKEAPALDAYLKQARV